MTRGFWSNQFTDADYISRWKARCVVNEQGCWLWQGALVGNGYPGSSYRGTNCRVHKASYELHRGPVPEGWDVCHTCDNKLCINPLHLFAAPRVANLIDMRNKGRNRQTQKTHCPQGHSYAEYGKPHYTKPTWRICTACVRDKMRREQADGTALARQRRYRARRRELLLQSGKEASK